VPTDVTAFYSAQFTPYAGSWALSSANRFGLQSVPSNKPDEKKENNNTNSNKDNKDNSTISGPSVNGQEGLDILGYLYNPGQPRNAEELTYCTERHEGSAGIQHR
jgi:hypothetical protein